MYIRNYLKKNYFRGMGWLIVGVVGLFWGIDFLEAQGVSGYAARRFGNLFTIAVCVIGAYRVSRDVLKIDPGTGGAGSPIAYAILQACRVALIVGFAIAANIGV